MAPFKLSSSQHGVCDSDACRLCPRIMMLRGGLVLGKVIISVLMGRHPLLYSACHFFLAPGCMCVCVCVCVSACVGVHARRCAYFVCACG